MEGPLDVQIVVFMPIPKSWPVAKKYRAEAGKERPTSRPDIDNLVKAAFDGISGVVFANDAQVVSLSAEKRYGNPRLMIEVYGKKVT